MKHHLYTLIATHLLAHPTTESSPHRLRVPNFPSPDPNKPIPPPAIPKGWKMGTILPLHSPALSGGGVSESMFREMMADMQNDGGGAGGGGGLPGLGGLGGMGGMAGLMGEMMGGGGGGGGSDSGGVGKKKIKEKEKDKKKKGRA
ncbi:MAG: Type I transmembrane sorting receptor [Watsoniomyces obsoletus]|nr:MAG: Type I transmembrane sorting receptor [Watsoniomyces obsoletus]